MNSSPKFQKGDNVRIISSGKIGTVNNVLIRAGNVGYQERVENRMVIMDMAATGEDNVLSNRSSDLEYRKEQLKKLQEEAIDFDEITGFPLPT